MSARLDAALAESEAAKRRLRETGSNFQQRLDPSRALGQVTDRLRSQAVDLVLHGADAINRNPAIAAGGVGLVLLVVAGKPIARILSRPFRSGRKR